ncbi:glutathione synthase [Dendrothele bispora CBS 962.96]|uniref:Glutathione synthetase n=1 Tax=Dendrothele bispora (strain CBS 962.96) TaxID=1314807 RepID=A0A4S8LJ47_DENBC|nr:glutathione synthase [Dendrothele bispora CBS 962.96]
MASKSTFDFAQWPPKLASSHSESLLLRATRYALAHGLLYLPPGIQPSIPASAIHAPFSLLPTPFPRGQFERAKRLQSIYNVLYARIAMDTEFLDEVMGQERGVGKVDDFVGKLWSGWKALRDEGLDQRLHLGLFRSDYLLHVSGSADDEILLKQVEFNTISSSFGTLSQRVSEMHRHLYATTGFFDLSTHLKPENFPPNDTVSGLAEGLVAAHAAYNVPGSQVLFVVQPGERNVFDQLWLEYELLERHFVAPYQLPCLVYVCRHSIPVIRCTLDELSTRATVSGVNQPLYISTSSTNTIEISTIYFRSCYTPTDFRTPEHYSTRFLLEKSRAIKCPSIPLQLAGGKKVQEVLTREGVVEKFLLSQSDSNSTSCTKEDIDDLKESWMQMWGLDASPSETGSGGDGIERALSNHLNLVLKPQREGGGNNVYKEDIPPFLETLKDEEKAAWIAMELINPPKALGGYLVRAGDTGNVSTEEKVVKSEVVSELGIFGWALFGDGLRSTERTAGEVSGRVREKQIGWLVRTKGKESNEGGVATGFSVLDSIVLVD